MGFGDRAPLSFAYSDHHHDAFLLGFSEFPFAVRPTAKLRRLAGEKGWPVMDWARETPAWLEKLGKLLLLVAAAAPGPWAAPASATRPARPPRRNLPGGTGRVEAREGGRGGGGEGGEGGGGIWERARGAGSAWKGEDRRGGGVRWGQEVKEVVVRRKKEGGRGGEREEGSGPGGQGSVRLPALKARVAGIFTRRPIGGLLQ